MHRRAMRKLGVRALAALGQVAIALFQHILERQFAEIASDRRPRFLVDPLAGVRINCPGGEIRVWGGRQVDQTEPWVDLATAAHTGIDRGEWLSLFGAGDVGGIVTSSDFA